MLLPQAAARAFARGSEPVGHRSRTELYGRRPLARHRGRQRCRLPDDPRPRSAGGNREQAGSRGGIARRRGGLDLDASGYGASLVKALSDLRVKLFADGADWATIHEMCGDPLIAGFTTN